MEQTWYNNNPGWPEKASLIPLHSNISIHQAVVSSSSSSSPFILPWPPAIYGPIPSPLSYNTHNANVAHHVGQGGEGEEEEDPALAAHSSKSSHSQAEKRRRERINTHLSTLRRLIPHSHKMDKAALLGTVVDRVKELRRKVVEISQVSAIPSEFDEVTVVDCAGHENAQHPTVLSTTNNSNKKDDNNLQLLLKASVCCQDRPELLRDVIRALKGLKLRAVRADIVTVGGRVINILTLSTATTSSSSCNKSVNLSSLKQSLKMVLSRVTSSSASSNYLGLSRKRQRILFPSSRR